MSTWENLDFMLDVSVELEGSLDGELSDLLLIYCGFE